MSKKEVIFEEPTEEIRKSIEATNLRQEANVIEANYDRPEWMTQEVGKWLLETTKGRKSAGT